MRRKLAALDCHCAAAGRPPEGALGSLWSPAILLGATRCRGEAKLALLTADQLAFRPAVFVGTPAAQCERLRAAVGAGIRYFVVNSVGDDLEILRLLRERVVRALTCRSCARGLAGRRPIPLHRPRGRGSVPATSGTSRTSRTSPRSRAVRAAVPMRRS